MDRPTLSCHCELLQQSNWSSSSHLHRTSTVVLPLLHQWSHGSDCDGDKLICIPMQSSWWHMGDWWWGDMGILWVSCADGDQSAAWDSGLLIQRRKVPLCPNCWQDISSPVWGNLTLSPLCRQHHSTSLMGGWTSVAIEDPANHRCHQRVLSSNV